MSPTFDSKDLNCLKEIAQTWNVSKDAQEQISKIVRDTARLSLRRILEDCKVSISPSKKELVIGCKTKLQELSLILRRRQLAQLADSIALQRISIYMDGEKSLTIPVNAFLKETLPIVKNSLDRDLQ